MHPTRDHHVSRRLLLGTAAAAAAVGVPAAADAAGPHAPAGPFSLRPRAVRAETAAIEADLVALRRDLHAHPEGPGQEAGTAARVAELLTGAGLDVTTGVGGHGVVGVLNGHHRGRTVAYRADMDAVPPQDQIDGVDAPAHLCGHDLHTAIGVGVALVLARLRRRLRGTVVFLFQPAEETLSGAKAMIEDGVLAEYAFEEIHALHCGPMPVGTLAVTPGSGLPGQDRGTVTFTGPDAAARAERVAAGIGALATVAQPQTPADLERLIADIQIEDGPLASFVFTRAAAEGGQVRFASRCWPEDRYTEVRADIDRIARTEPGADVAFPTDPYPAMVCPERDAYALKRFLDRTGTETGVVHAAIPFSGEDFAYFLDEVPGTYSYVGVRAPGAAIDTAYPHFGTFEPDEAAIGHGVNAMASWLAERSSR